jgi:hypothetical protein
VSGRVVLPYFEATNEWLLLQHNVQLFAVQYARPVTLKAPMQKPTASCTSTPLPEQRGWQYVAQLPVCAAACVNTAKHRDLAATDRFPVHKLQQYQRTDPLR